MLGLQSVSWLPPRLYTARASVDSAAPTMWKSVVLNEADVVIGAGNTVVVLMGGDLACTP